MFNMITFTSQIYSHNLKGQVTQYLVLQHLHIFLQRGTWGHVQVVMQVIHAVKNVMHSQ